MSDHDYSWVCNECGAREYTFFVSEGDIARMTCANCGSNEFHKVFSPAPLQKDYTALEAENRKLREALRDVLSWAGKDKKKLTRRGWTLEKEIRSLNRAAEALIDGDERKEQGNG